MSFVNTCYVVAGYDLFDYKADGFCREWRFSEEGEKYTDSQRPGNIQLFTDSYYGYHLIFGYIIAVNSEYEHEDYEMSIEDILAKKAEVDKELYTLIENGIISKECIDNAKFKIHVFYEEL